MKKLNELDRLLIDDVEAGQSRDGQARSVMASQYEAAIRRRDENRISAGTQFMPLTICPLPPKGVQELEWIRKSHNFEFQITGGKGYGVPHGQDILVFLYLTTQAAMSASPVIHIPALKHIADMFGLPKSRIDRVKDGLLRLSRASVRIVRTTNDEKRERDEGLAFTLFHRWRLSFDPGAGDAGSDWTEGDFVELSDVVFREVMAHPIPFSIETVRALRGKHTALPYYLWLSYRTYVVWRTAQIQGRQYGDLFIPFFGPNGLQTQLATMIKRRVDFRRRIKEWTEAIAKAWPALSDIVHIGVPGDERRKDGLYIRVSDPSQLDIPVFRSALADSHMRCLQPSCRGHYEPRAMRVGEPKKLVCDTCGDTVSQEEYESRRLRSIIRQTLNP